ncbi:MAG: AraC family transcriptional regulator [Candidatus Pseudomonas phytovorans]|uniref:AraC family transcriptional regulator n=1 Tax=Candidatus Pseudomonas phytovorans TaxID=3121377 RepID=A0AAJ5WF03_9PSED|nr:AraC family transcriptional regulator [Pseudomonas sp.]WEK29213.1 MAG: AraC family transcriptional regulator [Pseudomonas sp.]
MTRKPFILRSRDMRSEDFGALFSQMFGSLYADMPPLGEGISIGGVYGRFEGMSVRRMQYGGDFSIRLPTPQDEITFVLPTAGKIIFDHRGESMGGARVGMAVDKRDIRTVRFADNHAQHGMSIRRELFAERLSLLLGRGLAEPVRFAPVVDLAVPEFQGIRALLELATGTQFDPLINSGLLMPARLQEMLVDAVLEAWPHNYTEALHSPAPALAPRHVKLAMAYLREHPAGLVSGTELAGVANVSLRALQEGFRRFAGTSIVGYQRQVRLERARQVLAHGDGGSVAEVALRHGFSNAGRFAQYFQQAFGVSPAEVRRGR